MNRSVEIICVGNELLTGHTLNTNAHWMAREVTKVGGMVRRVTVIRDEVDEISRSIKESVKRKPLWIIISGGLGPTYDDKTLQGLAKALGRKLTVNKEAVNMLRRKYVKTANPSLTPWRYKMATMPVNSKPLDNPVGHAPAAMVKHDSCTIFALPGVPREMESIFSKYIIPILRKNIGKFVRKEMNLETKGIVESVLAPYLDIVITKNPDIYVKSHPKGYNKGVSTLHINITAEGRDSKTAGRYLKEAVKQMKFFIKEAGGSVREI